MNSTFLEMAMVKSRRLTIAFWAVAFISLASGSYFWGGYPGLLIGIGVFFSSVAMTQEINRQLWPIGLVAIAQLERMEEPHA